MRVQEIRFEAWGGFPRGAVLRPAEGAPLHVVLGPNEAGKSTFLRGLHALLFGMEARTAASWQHREADLEVAGRAVLADGRALAWSRGLRRKGFTGTLAGAALDRDGFEALFHPVDRARWQGLYGFSDEQLRAAGAALRDVPLDLVLAGERDPAEVRRQLVAEAEALVPPKRLVGAQAHLKELRDALDAARRAEVSPHTYREREAGLASAQAARADAEGQARQARAGVDRASRLREALPLHERARVLRRRLEALAPHPGLGRGSAAALEALVTAQTGAGALAAEAARALVEVREERARIEVPEAVLAEAGRIDHLTQDLRRHLESTAEALRERERLDGEARRLTAQAQDLLGEGSVNPEDVVAQRPLRAAAVALLERWRRATEALRSHGRERERLELEQAAQSAAPPEDAVRDARLEAILAGEPAHARRREALAEAEQELAERSLALTRLRAALAPVWPMGEPTPAPPSEAEVRDAEQELARLRQAAALAEQRLGEREREAEQASLVLARAEAEAAVPDPEALQALRRAREEAWRAWQEGAGAPLTVEGHRRRFVELVEACDTLADELYAQAAAVQARRVLRAEAQLRQEAVGAAKGQVGELQARRAAWEEGWRQRWPGLVPESPAAMLGWRQAFERWRAAAGEAEPLPARIEGLRDAVARYEAEACEAAGTPGGWAAALPVLRAAVAESRRRSLAREQQQARAAKIEVALATCVLEEGHAQAALAAVEEERRALLGAAGLPAITPMEQLPDLLQAVADLQEGRRRLAAAEARLRAVEAREADWVADVRRVLPPLLSWAAERSAEDLVVEAGARLDAARRARERAAQLDLELRRAAARLEESQAAEARARAAVRDELARVGAPDGETYRGWALAAAEAADLGDELQRCQAGLAPLRREDPAFDDALEGRSADDLDAACAEAQEALAVAEEALALSLKAEHAAERALAEIDGSAAGADAVQRAAEARSRLRSSVEEWLVTQVAIRLLDLAQRRIEGEREPAVLARTGTYFARLTGGRYPSVRTAGGLDLRAVRADGEELAPAALSDGTLQQLYFAARLAWAERFNEEAEPMPLVLDDVLSAFDVERTSAALSLLGELPGQKFLLTHHAHVAALAAEVVPGVDRLALPGG